MGVNCCPPENVLGLLKRITTVNNNNSTDNNNNNERRAKEKKVIVYPNSGEIWDANSKEWKPRRASGRSHTNGSHNNNKNKNQNNIE